MPRGLDPQNTEAILGIVERSPLDQFGKHFSRFQTHGRATDRNQPPTNPVRFIRLVDLRRQPRLHMLGFDPDNENPAAARPL